MLNLKEARNASPRDLRIFAGLLGPFLVLIFWLWVRWPWPTWAWGVVASAAVFGVVGVVRPNWIRPAYVVWVTVFFPIGWIISQIALTAVYYLVVTPIGWLRRTTSGDPMKREFDKQAETYWEPRRQVEDVSRYFRQY